MEIFEGDSTLNGMIVFYFIRIEEKVKNKRIVFQIIHEMIFTWNRKEETKWFTLDVTRTITRP